MNHSTKPKKSPRKAVKPRVAKTRAGGRWTEAQFWSFLRSGLRSKYTRWPVRYDVMNEVRRPCKGKGRQQWEYKCSICLHHFPQKGVEVDHYPEACGPLKSFDDLARFTRALFCEKDNLRVVCKDCHAAHTASERKKK